MTVDDGAGSRPREGRGTVEVSAADRIKSVYPVRLFQAFGKSQAGYYAASLAFQAFMSMFPLILGLLAVLGLAIRDPDTQERFKSEVLGFFPSDAHSALSGTLSGVSEHAGILGVIGIAGLLWSGGSLFTTMEWALGRIVGAGQRDFLRQRLMAFSMTGVFILAIVGSVAVNSIMGLLPAFSFIGPLVGVAVWTCFTLALYRFVPNRTFPVRELWRGALLAGVLMEVLTLVWPLYTHLSHGFNTYGSTFALFFLLATWLYLLSQLILLGAVANRMSAGRPIAEGALAAAQGGTVETEATVAADELAGRAS
jgi:membrane protein